MLLKESVLPELQKLLVDTYQPYDIERIVEMKMRSLKQTGSVTDYVNKFNELAYRAPNMSESEKTKIFIDGLKDASHVGYAMPDSLAAAKEIAIRRETFFRNDIKHQNFKGEQRYSKSSEKGTNVGKPQSILKDGVTRQTTKCYNCGQMGHYANNCPKADQKSKQQKKVNIIDKENKNPTKLLASTYSHKLINMINLSSSLVYDNADLPKILGKLNGQEVNIVLDSGASNSVISSRFVTKYDIKINTQKTDWKVKLADGSTSSEPIITTVPIEVEVQGRVCNIPFIVFPHDQIDVLLGVDWMCFHDVGIHPKSIDVVQFPKEKLLLDVTNCLEVKIDGKPKRAWLCPNEPLTLISNSVVSLNEANNLTVPITLTVQNRLIKFNVKVASIDVDIKLGKDWLNSSEITLENGKYYFPAEAVQTSLSATSEHTVLLSEIDSNDSDLEEQVIWFDEKYQDYEINISEPMRSRVIKFLETNSDAFAKDIEDLGCCDVREHHVRTNLDVPIYQHPYRKSMRERMAIREEIAKMLKARIIRASQSPWSSPVVMIPKKDGSHRFCVDYRKLNKITDQDPYPMPRIDDILDRLRGSVVFSALDLRSGFWQVKVAADSIMKTAFTTPDGH